VQEKTRTSLLLVLVIESEMVRESVIASRSAAMDVGVVRVSKAAIRELVVARRQTLMMSIPRMDTAEAMKSLRLGIGVPMVEMSLLFSFLCARPRMPLGKT
jgi:hypothetical protein